LLKYVDRAEFLSSDDKKYYTDIIQSMAMDEELLLIFYNSVIFPTMQQLIRTHNIVRNLPRKLLLDPAHENENMLPLEE
jgi:hypothetical protein